MLLAATLAAAGCGGESTPLEPTPDPCAEAPEPLAVGATVTGTLDADQDCLADDGRLFDGFLVTLTEPTLLAVTLGAAGYRPFMPFYETATPDTVQVSGWASATEDTLTREHLFPAGAWLLRSSSFERAEEQGDPPVEGSWTLSTAERAVPQEGCGRETSVTYGSVAEGRLGEDDCEATREADDPVLRRSDGYDFLLRPGLPVEVVATADFPFRLAFWANGQPVETFTGIAAGESRRVKAGGTGFLSFYVRSEEEGVGGRYTLTFQPAPSATGSGPSPAPARGAPPDPEPTTRR